MTYDWFKISEVKELCERCRYRLDQGKMSTCEYANKQFPKARSCKEFQDLETVEI